MKTKEGGGMGGEAAKSASLRVGVACCSPAQTSQRDGSMENAAKFQRDDRGDEWMEGYHQHTRQSPYHHLVSLLRQAQWQNRLCMVCET
jgi:hypothetical protein